MQQILHAFSVCQGIFFSNIQEYHAEGKKIPTDYSSSSAFKRLV